jgi:hypothetical protein
MSPDTPVAIPKQGQSAREVNLVDPDPGRSPQSPCITLNALALSKALDQL